MLIIEVPSGEFFDERTDTFIKIKGETLKLEHSLISVSKWESKYQKPFIDNTRKTREELLDYIKCMSIAPVKDSNIFYCFGEKEFSEIVEYINSPMTATTVTFFDKKRGSSGEKVTSELIYYWMASYNIPFECEKWHINRLLTLIKVFSAKNQPEKKMNKVSAAKMQASLNAQRKAKLKSKG